MPLNIARIQAVCFDIDGTLRDTDDQYVARIARWLRPARFAFPGGDPAPFARRAVMALESPGTWLYSIPDRLGIDNRLAPLADWLDRRVIHQLMRKPAGRYPVVPGAPEAVRRLAARYPLAIVTARDERHTLEFLDQAGLRDSFRCVASALTCPRAKPFPHQILWAAQQMGVPPEACLMVGDTTVDIRAGKSAGAQAAGVLCGFGQENELRRAGADAILPSTADLITLL